jgi:hypothetical protein
MTATSPSPSPRPRAATPPPRAATPTGGDGGDARAKGGDGDASNNAFVKQSNESTGGKSDRGDKCGCRDKDDWGSSQSNESTIDQGENTATGGNAEATGGNGGNADTGNVQEGNGNAYARSETGEESRPPVLAMHPCLCQWSKPGGGGESEAEAKGGDTTATSGDATGGDGGDARASGGDADALNNAWVFQQNERAAKGGGLP